MNKVKGAGFGVRFYTRLTRRDSGRAVDAIAETGQENDKQKPAPRRLLPTKPAVVAAAVAADTITQALWQAARAGNCPAIRVLVMEGADLGARDDKGRTALNIATQYKQQDAIKTLMAAKEMHFMADLGVLPETGFFERFKKRVRA